MWMTFFSLSYLYGLEIKKKKKQKTPKTKQTNYECVVVKEEKYCR